MKKERKFIIQKDFNSNYNGYRVWHNSDYYTYANRESLGLDIWDDELTYYIR